MQLIVSCNGHTYIINGHTLICQWTHLYVNGHTYMFVSHPNAKVVVIFLTMQIYK